MREIIAAVGQEVPIGRCGEHLAARVSFDISEWVSIYGGGVVQLIHQRNGDSEPYPCVVERNGSTVTWDITNADTAVAGRGRAELQYFVGDAQVKSETYATTVERALSPVGDTPPEPHEAWVDNVLEAASRIDGAGMPRGYVEGMSLWRVGYVPGGNEYFVAGRTKYMENLSLDTVARPKGLTKTVLQYMPSPFPAHGCHVTATCDRLGQYISSVNSIYGDATVGFTFRVVDPSNPADHISTSARFIMASTRKKTPEKPGRAYNASVAAEIIRIAESYVTAKREGRKFGYGANFFYLKGRPINRATDGAGMMECDTFAGMVLRGISYEDSPYADATPGLEFTYAEMMANCKHSETKWCKDIRAQIASEEANNVHGRDIRFACDYAWLAWRNKGSVFSDIAHAKPGDLCFWRNTEEKTYFDNISHVAIMGEDGYIYEVSSSKYDADEDKSVLHVSLLSERTQPAYFARIYGEYEGTGEDEDDTSDDIAGDVDDDVVDDGAGDKEEGADDTPSVQDRLDELEQRLEEHINPYVDIAVTPNSFTTQERGAVVNSVTPTWKINRDPENLTISGAGIDGTINLSVTDRSYTVPEKNLGITLENTNSFKWTITATGERGEVSSKQTPAITFLNGIYYGVAAQPETVNSAFVLGLTKKLSSAKINSFTVNAGAGQYIWYCLPERSPFGTCTFKVGGFEGGFTLVDTIDFENASNYTERYHIYRSDESSLGNTTVGVS